MRKPKKISFVGCVGKHYEVAIKYGRIPMFIPLNSFNKEFDYKAIITIEVIKS